MRLLEIVRGAKTSKSTLATVDAAGAEDRQGRRDGRRLPRLCRQSHAGERQREANELILEGATPSDVDRVIVDFGMPMGPFGMSDLAGLDIGWSAETSKGATHPRNAVRGGPARPEDRRRLLRLRREAQRQALAACRENHPRLRAPSKGIDAAQDSDQEILERCIYPMVNEGAKILEEGKAQRASGRGATRVNVGFGYEASTNGAGAATSAAEHGGGAKLPLRGELARDATGAARRRGVRRRADRRVPAEAPWPLTGRGPGQHRVGDHRDLRARDAADPRRDRARQGRDRAKLRKLLTGAVVGVAAGGFVVRRRCCSC